MKLKSGFSLIELLVVVAIIGILAAIGTVGYNNYINSANSAKFTANDKQIMDALLVEDAKLSICTAASDEAGVKACANAIATAANIASDSWSGGSMSCDGATFVIGSQRGNPSNNVHCSF